MILQNSISLEDIYMVTKTHESLSDHENIFCYFAVCKSNRKYANLHVQVNRLPKPYSRAVMDMLPHTPYPYDAESRRPQAHESINDLPVHEATKGRASAGACPLPPLSK